MSRTTDPVEFVQAETADAVVVDNPAARPNIVLIALDDVGVDYLAQYSGFQLSHLNYVNGSSGWGPVTTGIGRLAQNGVKFLNAFANPTCSPTRSMLMSGRYSSRQGIGTVIKDSAVGECREYSDSEYSTEPTLAEFLKAQGYRTMMCGKYHLGLPTVEMDVPLPANFTEYSTIGWDGPTDVLGFDCFRGHFRNLNQRPEPENGTEKKGYYNYYWYESDNVTSQPGNPDGPNEHATRKQRGQITNWINHGNKDGTIGATEPWFVYWPTSVAHSPYGDSSSATASGMGCPDIAGDPAVEGLAAWVYTAGYQTPGVVGSVWSAVENLAYELEMLKIKIGDDVWGRTVFILVGDNGTDGIVMDSFQNGFTGGGVVEPPHPMATYLGTEYGGLVDNPTNHFKTSVYRPGTAVPLIISGPDWLVKNKNRDSSALVDVVDIHATIRRIAQADYTDATPDTRGHDGADLYDVLADITDADEDHRTQSLSERFSPCGNVDQATSHSYVYRQMRSDGIWHLVQNDATGGDEEDEGGTPELYHTMDASFAAVDVNELNDLALTEPAVLLELQQNYAALIASIKDDQWPTT